MPPNQFPAPQTGGQPPSDYDFIMNTGKPKRQFGGSLFNGSPKSLMMLIGGAVVIIILIIIIASALKPAGIKPELTQLAQSQAELARVAQLNDTDVSGQTTNNFATSTAIVLASQEYQLTSLLASYNIEISSDVIEAGQNPATDQALDEATQNGSFSSKFSSIMKDQLNSYGDQLASIYKKTDNQDLKSQLDTDYEDVGVLLEMAKQ